MPDIISVRFRSEGKQYYFDPQGETCRVGDGVIVETAAGKEYAVCVRGNFTLPEEELTAPLRCKAKTRYRQQEEWATVTPLADGKIQVTFDEPQRAMTVGQAVVLYDGDTVLGGGTILSVPDEEQGETL